MSLGAFCMTCGGYEKCECYTYTGISKCNDCDYLKALLMDTSSVIEELEGDMNIIKEEIIGAQDIWLITVNECFGHGDYRDVDYWVTTKPRGSYKKKAKIILVEEK